VSHIAVARCDAYPWARNCPPREVGRRAGGDRARDVGIPGDERIGTAAHHPSGDGKGVLVVDPEYYTAILHITSGQEALVDDLVFEGGIMNLLRPGVRPTAVTAAHGLILH